MRDRSSARSAEKSEWSVKVWQLDWLTINPRLGPTQRACSKTSSELPWLSISLMLALKGCHAR
jgi:hypothetical protein